jgi:crotonobetainyl-CoA:carnitine CoA-transferase CaiB-like acyl-CoA transferase
MFAAADGFLVVACAKETLWRKLCDALGQSELAEDERFTDFEAHNRNRDALMARLKEAFAKRDVGEWIDVLTAPGVPSAPGNDIDAALADEQTRERGSLVEYEHPTLGPVRTIASPYGASLTREPARAPLLGEYDQGDDQ